MVTGRIPFAGPPLGDPYRQTLWELMQRRIDTDAQFNAEERERSQATYATLANMPIALHEQYLGAKEREQANLLAQAKAQAVQDQLKFRTLQGQTLGSLEQVEGVTVPELEDRSARVTESSYTPELSGIIARRLAKQDQPSDGTILDIMQIDPSVALPRPAPGTYDPTMMISSGHPDVPGFEAPIRTAGTLRKIQDEQLAAEASKAEAERMADRKESLWKLSVETKPTSQTENIYIDEDGKIVPRILETRSFFDPDVGRHVTTSQILTGPNGQPVTHEIPVQETKTYHPDLVDKNDNVVYVNRRNPSDKIETGLPSTRIAAARAGVDPPKHELAPRLSDESQSQLLEMSLTGAVDPFKDNATVFGILDDPESLVSERQAITHVLSKPLQSWQEFTGFGERPRTAMIRLQNAQIGLLQALSDPAGQPSERERQRVLKSLRNLMGTTLKSPDAFKTELRSVRDLLGSILKSSLVSLPAGDSPYATRQQGRWSSMAAASELFAHSAGLPSILATIRYVSDAEIANYPDDPGIGN